MDGNFKIKKKRCQSAHPLNKNYSKKRINRILSSVSASQIAALQVHGQNISSGKQLSLKPSLEATLSRKLINSNDNTSKRSSEKVVIAAVQKESTAEDAEGTLLVAAQ